jgi:hypothetical protein
VVSEGLSGDLAVKVSAGVGIEQAPIHGQAFGLDVVEGAVKPEFVLEDGPAQGEVSFPVCFRLTGKLIPGLDKEPIAALKISEGRLVGLEPAFDLRIVRRVAVEGIAPGLG